MDLKAFNKSLSQLSEKGNSLQLSIHEMAVYAIGTVNNGRTVGQDSPIQRLWDVLHTLKGINQQAFMQWAQEYGMLRFVKVESGGFVVKFYDKQKKNPEFKPDEAVQIAEGIPFWEFAREPEPNLKPYDVINHMKTIITQATNAATGGAKHDKPKRKVEHAEMLDVIVFAVNNPNRCRELLGLMKPSETVEKIEASAADTTMADAMQHALEGKAAKPGRSRELKAA